MEKSLGEIMHGLSEENIAREEELFENMPVFPRISRSKNLTMLLVHRVKSCTPVPKGCDILAEGLYVDENYTYRYLGLPPCVYRKAKPWEPVHTAQICE